MNDPEQKKSYLEQIDIDTVGDITGGVVDIASSVVDAGPDLIEIVGGMIGAVFEGLVN